MLMKSLLNLIKTLHLLGVSFKERVLVTLAKKVPFGKTITYGELASLAGSPGL